MGSRASGCTHGGVCDQGRAPGLPRTWQGLEAGAHAASSASAQGRHWERTAGLGRSSAKQRFRDRERESCLHGFQACWPGALSQQPLALVTAPGHFLACAHPFWAGGGTCSRLALHRVGVANPVSFSVAQGAAAASPFSLPSTWTPGRMGGPEAASPLLRQLMASISQPPPLLRRNPSGLERWDQDPRPPQAHRP